jgi:pimeloyl-ACP methyl ester carboxylesterase
VHKLPLHVERHGSGPSLVLQHGFGGSARNFRPQARAFAGSLSVVLFDARGHARSPAPRDAHEYELSCFVRDFAGVLDAASSEPAVTGGLSMGAAVALQHALAFPERVRGLVLAAFPSSGENERRRDWALGFAQAIEERGLDAAGSEFVWGARSRFDPKGAALIRQGFLEHPPHALAHVLRQVLARLASPSSLAPALTRLAMPVLVIVGSEDRESLEPSTELAELLPHAELRVVPEAGHIVNLAKPREFNAAVARFLRDEIGLALPPDAASETGREPGKV